MKTLFVLCLCGLLLNSASAAPGDILSATVATNGWAVQIVLANLATNGAYNFGFATNSSVLPGSTSNLLFSLTSRGFDDSGNAIATVKRKLYGTAAVRFAYPNNGFMSETMPTVNAVQVTIALSDFLFSTESNISLTAPAGWYSQGGTNCNATNGLAVVNNSILPHPKCIANWTWPGYQRISNNLMTLRAMAFHRSGQLGRPVRALQFIARDQHAHAVTNWVTAPAIDWSMGDAIPIPEYYSTLNLAGFTAQDAVRCDFAAYPWIGDTNSILTTLDNLHSQPTPLYASITNWLDGNPAVVAVVSFTNWSATPAVVSNFNALSPPAAFSNISAAASAIVLSNSAWFGRGDLSGATIYLHQGNYNFAGGSGSYGTYPKAWCTVASFPGETGTINGHSGDFTLQNLVSLQNVTITDNAESLTGFDQLWFDRVLMNSTVQPLFYQVACVSTTRSTIQNAGDGLFPFGAELMQPTLIRGNFITNLYAALVYTMAGNFLPTNNAARGGVLVDASVASPFTDNNIYAYNSALNVVDSGNAFFLVIDTANTNGFAIVNNVWEKVGGTTQPIIHIASDASLTGHDVFNVILWNNVAIGDRNNIGYNDVTTNNPLRTLWSVKGNYFDDWNCKDDGNYLQTAPAYRTNNWAVRYGAGFDGNVDGEFAGGPASGSFQNQFFGLNSISPAGTLPTNYVSFLGYKTGNYRTLSSSVLQTLGPPSCPVPFDLEGNPRSVLDQPGAYSTASPLKGNMF